MEFKAASILVSEAQAIESYERSPPAGSSKRYEYTHRRARACSEILRIILRFGCPARIFAIKKEIMAVRRTLSNSLRVIGQVLQQRGLDLFDLRHSGDEFFLQCGGPMPPYLDLVELRYTLAQIEALDSRARIGRGASLKLVNVQSLPEILRAIGRRIDDQGGHLVRLCNSDFPTRESFTVEYRTVDKHRQVERLVMPGDHAMRM